MVIEMDTRELDARLSFIEMSLTEVKQLVTNIEAVIQQYWTEFMQEKTALDKNDNQEIEQEQEEEKPKKKAVIKVKDEGKQL